MNWKSQVEGRGWKREEKSKRVLLNRAVQVVNRRGASTRVCRPKIIFRSKWKCCEIESSPILPLAVYYSVAQQDFTPKTILRLLSVSKHRRPISLVKWRQRYFHIKSISYPNLPTLYIADTRLGMKIGNYCQSLFPSIGAWINSSLRRLVCVTPSLTSSTRKSVADFHSKIPIILIFLIFFSR